MNRTRIPPEFKLVFPQFERKFLHGEAVGFSFQRKYFKPMPGKPDLIYFPEKGVPLTESEWITHFYTAPVATKSYSLGSLAMNGTFAKSVLKWIVFDLDNFEIKQRFEKLIAPRLEFYGIERISEDSGDGDRVHEWIMVDAVSRPLVEAFIDQLLIEVGTTKQEFDEIYPLFNKRRNVIRFPGGYHLRRGKRYPCHYNGKFCDDPISIMRAFIECKPITEAQLKSWVRELPRVIGNESKGERKDPEKFFHSLDLPLPFNESELPETAIKPLKNCNAMSKTLRDIKSYALNKRDASAHEKGLFWARVCMYNDLVQSTRKKIVDTGKKFFNLLKTKFRFRPAEGHNWDSNYADMYENPNRFYPNCEAWERFGYCEGCKFRNVIVSPKNFHWGDEIIQEEVGEMVLKTAEEIRQTTFVEFKKQIKHDMKFGLGEVILLASPQGAGKSWIIGDIIKEDPHKTYVIMTRDGEQARQHRNRLKGMGIDSLVMMGHENVFKYLMSFDECPDHQEIRRLTELGMSGPYIREKICDLCPFYDECHWPQQYKMIKADDCPKVIIIQHAHMGTPIMYDVIRKRPDLIFVDETFIDNLYTFIKPKADEIKLLKTFQKQMEWMPKFIKWLEGSGWADGDINPTEDELERLQKSFSNILRKDQGMQWSRIADMIRAFKGKHHCSQAAGIRVVHEFPQASLIVMTDATPPKDLIEALTGLRITKVIGANEIIDVTRIHPQNKVVQILDTSVSQAALLKNDLFYEILAKIAYLCETEYEGKQVLLTVYQNWVPDVIDYFKKQYPSTIGKRLEVFAKLKKFGRMDVPFISENGKPRPDSITIDWMRRGTNAYVGYDAQFLMAGVFNTGDQYYQAAYKYKSVANFHLERRGEEQISNPYPYDAVGPKGKLIQIEREPYAKSAVMIIDGKAKEVEFPQFQVWTPVDTWFLLHHELNRGSFQQSNRIRWSPDKPRHSYVLGNMRMDGYAVTEVQTIRQFVNSY